MGFNLIYCTPMGCSYVLSCSNLEKYGKFWKNGRFSGQIWPGWGNTAWADMTGLGSIGFKTFWTLFSCIKIGYLVCTHGSDSESKNENKMFCIRYSCK